MVNPSTLPIAHGPGNENPDLPGATSSSVVVQMGPFGISPDDLNRLSAVRSAPGFKPSYNPCDAIGRLGLCV